MPAAAAPAPAGLAEAKSPGLGARDGLGAAFELKYQLDPDDAARVEAWAHQHLHPDRHGDRGRYRITSVYCDTPGLDVFHRNPGFKRNKYRVRRYDAAARIFVERKTKRGDRVTKRRTDIDPAELAHLLADAPPEAWPAGWFATRVRSRNLRPTCCVSYRRTAFFGMAGDMPVRMTIDRDMVGVPATDWQVPHIQEGHALLPDAVLVELKFHLHMPPLFQDLLSLLPGQLARASKYRRCISLCGIWDGQPPAGAPAGGAAPVEGVPQAGTDVLPRGIA
ncbi:MAG TPA: polyphosphate polymerase domain-containing protein [Humisphaera sp.]